MPPTIHLYSAYFGNFPLLPKASYVTPVQAGAVNTKDKLNMIGDDTGDNISAQNPFFSELTVAYWVYKNADRAVADAFGLCHYRRYFIENKYKLTLKKRSRYYCKTSQKVLDSLLTSKLYNTLQNLLEKNDVIVQRPIWAKKVKGKIYNIKDAYIADHIQSDYDTTMQVVIELYPEFKNSITSFGQLTKMSFNNMMIARWEIWDQYLNFLFNVLGVVEKRIDIIKPGYQSRVFGFLAERLHNLFIHHNKLKTGYLTLGLFEDKLP